MSIELGKFNQLEVVKEVDFGVYLDGGEEGEILLPTRYVPEDCKIGDFLNVFLYLDMDERLIATTLTPLVQVGQFACLEVSWVNQYGAFLNWGLMKDLFVPFREQKMKIQPGGVGLGVPFPVGQAARERHEPAGKFNVQALFLLFGRDFSFENSIAPKAAGVK